MKRDKKYNNKTSEFIEFVAESFKSKTECETICGMKYNIYVYINM